MIALCVPSCPLEGGRQHHEQRMGRVVPRELLSSLLCGEEWKMLPKACSEWSLMLQAETGRRRTRAAAEGCSSWSNHCPPGSGFVSGMLRETQTHTAACPCQLLFPLPAPLSRCWRAAQCQAFYGFLFVFFNENKSFIC